MEQLNVEQRWPELFVGLDERQRHSVRQALASSWHEGWTPNRRDVESLTALTRGEITHEDFLHRARQAAREAAAQRAS